MNAPHEHDASEFTSSEHDPLADDLLAEEIRSYRPIPVSPRLREAISGGFVERRRSGVRWMVATVLVAAASVLVAVLVRPLLTPVTEGDDSAVPPVIAGPPVIPDEGHPHDTPNEPDAQPVASLWAYRRAAARSMDELDSLLTLDAARLLPAVEPVATLRAGGENGI